MVIDFHTHIFPDSLAQKALGRLVDNLRDYEPQYDRASPYTDATAAGLAASAKAAGIDICVVMPIATSPRSSETLNSFAARINKTPGFRSFGSVHPDNPDALKELECISTLGLPGIKLHPEYQSCYADNDKTVALVRRAAELGLWVLFHAGADVGMPPPVHGAPEHFLRLRRSVPDAKIILAHMGAFRLWEHALKKYPGNNFFVDTSFSIEVYPERQHVFAELIRAIGTDHVMFGSDSPWACQTKSLVETKTFLSKYGFSSKETADILGNNASLILGIE